MATVASPSSRNQTPSSLCSFSYPFASYTSGNFAPKPPPRPHALFLLLWPPSVFFFHLFATVSNIVIREILLRATTRLPRTTLHAYKEVQLEPTSSWALLRKDFAAPSKYTGIFQASKDIFREEGFQGFWRGNVPALLMVMPYTTIQFRVLHKLKTLASGSSKSEDHSSLSPYLFYVSGALAGCAATIESCPFDLLRTILASQGEPKQGSS